MIFTCLFCTFNVGSDFSLVKGCSDHDPRPCSIAYMLPGSVETVRRKCKELFRQKNIRERETMAWRDADSLLSPPMATEAHALSESVCLAVRPENEKELLNHYAET